MNFETRRLRFRCVWTWLKSCWFEILSIDSAVLMHRWWWNASRSHTGRRSAITCRSPVGDNHQTLIWIYRSEGCVNSFECSSYWLCLIASLIDWLIDWLTHWLIESLLQVALRKAVELLVVGCMCISFRHFIIISLFHNCVTSLVCCFIAPLLLITIISSFCLVRVSSGDSFTIFLSMS